MRGIAPSPGDVQKKDYPAPACGGGVRGPSATQAKIQKILRRSAAAYELLWRDVSLAIYRNAFWVGNPLNMTPGGVPCPGVCRSHRYVGLLRNSRRAPRLLSS